MLLTKRQIRALLAALALSLCLGGAAMAAALIPCEFKECVLSLSLPEDWGAFTWDPPADDLSCALFGLTREDTDALLSHIRRAEPA